MGRLAKTVYDEPEEIARIERLVCELPSQARVRVVLRDGHAISGTVTERPAAQLFEDASGHEGFNAMLRLDDPIAPPWTAYLWLSDVERVERLDPPN